MAAIVTPGYIDGGNDYGISILNSYADLRGLSGVNGWDLVKTGQTFVGFSGVTGGKVVVALDNTYGRPKFSVADVFGTAAGTNIIISGAPGASGFQFNGAPTYTINTNYGHATFQLVSGVNFITV